MSDILKGKRILVAGGGGGIASTWCKYFAQLGAKVMVNDVGYLQDANKGGDYDLNSSSKDVADKVVDEIIRNNGIAVADYENVADFEGAKRAVEHCVKEFGGIDVLLNATCVSQICECSEMQPEQWDAVIKNNLYPVFNLCRNTLPYMIDQQFGRIILTTSVVIRSFWGSVNYAASYAGVYSFMRTLANEVRRDGITVNCIEPTAAGKTGKRNDGQKFLDRRARALGLDDMQGSKITSITPKPEALSPFVAYLMTDEAKNINGQHFAIKGGRYAIYDTFQEKKYLYKDESLGDWTVEELINSMPNTLETDMVPLWFPRK